MLDGGTAVVRVIADASKLNATIAASTKGATSGLAGIGSKITSALSNPFVIAGGVVAGVTAKMGFDFEDAFNKIDAISNASSADLEKWRANLEHLGHETAQSPKDLADALYFLASAGLKANEVFPALEASAKASAVGLGSVAQVGSVVAAVLNAYAGEGLQATDVTDTLVAAVRESRAETDEFGQTLGRLLPISARAGITFGELAGSLASLSNIGLDVYEASTAMRAAIQAITAPGEKAANTMEEMGLSSQDLLDSIHQNGLLGALQLLDKAIRTNTDSESEYLRKFRDIVPNVRALTGVLGLTGDNLKHVKDIFQATTHATGDLADALSVVQSGPAFKFRQALNDLVETGTELGTHIFPVITDILNTIAPLLRVAADNAGKLLTAFLLYKSVTWLPGLLTAISTGIIALTGAEVAAGAGAAPAVAKNIAAYVAAKAAAAEAAGAGSGLVGVLGGVAAASTKAAAATFTAVYALGDQASYASNTKTEMEDLNNAALTYYNGLQKGTLDQIGLNTYIAASVPALHGNAEAFKYAAEHGVSYSDALWLVVDAGDEAAMHQKQVNKALRQAVHDVDEVGKAVKQNIKPFERWGFASDKAFSDFKEGIQKSIATAPGEFEKLSDVFKTTPAEAQKQLSLALQITRTKVADLKKIFNDKSLTRGQKLALAQLSPDLRHAFTTAEGTGKSSILHMATALARANSTNVGTIMAPLKNKLPSRAEAAGRAVGTGVATGITATTGAAVAAAAHLVNVVNTKMKDLWAFGSPSKVTKKYGQWIVEGLIIGIQSREKALENAAENITSILSDQLSKARDKYQAIVDKIKEKLPDNASQERIQAAIAHSVEAMAAETAIAMAKSRMQQAKDLRQMVKQAETALNKIIEKFKDFKESIKDGFSDFQDLGGAVSDAWKQYLDDMKAYTEAMKDYVPSEGSTAPVMPTKPDLSAVIADQVANAQRLAKDLQDAAAAGLSKELLAQFAGQGSAGADALEQLLANPALIAQLNDAYKVINAAANDTASALGNQFFGAAIKEATHDFRVASAALKLFILTVLKATDAAGVRRQLRHLLEVLQQGMQTGAGGPGGTGTGPGGPGPFQPGGSPTGPTTGGKTSGPIWVPTDSLAASSGSFGDVYITVNGNGDPVATAKEVRRELNRFANRNGGKTGVRGG